MEHKGEQGEHCDTSVGVAAIGEKAHLKFK